MRRTEPLRVVTIPQLPAPTIHEEPQYFPATVPIPRVITMGKEHLEVESIDDSGSVEGEAPGFRWYVEICEAYEAAGGEDEFSSAEVFQLYRLSEIDACGFAVYGLEVQQWMSFEAEYAELAGHVEDLRAVIRDYVKQLTEQHRIVTEGNAALIAQLNAD